MEESLYIKLVENLQELTRLYRALFDLINNEKMLLINADTERLLETAKTKEVLIHKIRAVDLHREELSLKASNSLKCEPRLLKIADKLETEKSKELKIIHSALDLLIQRLSEQNRENEQYAQSALKVLQGAINEVRGTLIGKKTYGQKGKMQEANNEKAGNFVSKEA